MYGRLNMSSANPTPATGALPHDDRTTRARIRDAAISCVAQHGVADTTARKVAAAAGVSPALVMHHFGTMEQLRDACDEHVTAVIRQQKQDAMRSGPGVDVLSLLRRADETSRAELAGYLARVLVEDTPAVARLVDELVTDAEQYLAEGEASGMIAPTDDPRGRAAVLTIWSLGALVLHRHLDRLVGADPTSPTFDDDPAAVAAYAGPALDILGGGVFTDAFATAARASLRAATEPRNGAEP